MNRGLPFCLTLLLSAAALAQPPAPALAFETADVHVSAPGSDTFNQILPGGRFVVRGMTMLRLITMAYGVDRDRVAGGPSWLNTDRFDITAKAPSSTPLSQETIPPMLQALLADRFKLAIHKEDRPMPVYVLLPGKRSPQLKPAASAEDPDCKLTVDAGVRTYACHAVTIAGLAERMAQVANAYFDHPVVDKTGLQGAYDFTLKWVPRGQLGGPGADEAGGSLYDYLDKQLGIKVEPQTQSTPVIVVDRVNQTPTPNPPGVTEALPPAPTEFEVAEVHAAKPGSTQTISLTNGRLEFISVPLKDLIAIAYGIDDNMVDNMATGAAKWLDTDRFDVIAKAAPTASFAEVKVMLRNQLVKSFKLSTHTEDQPVPVYALTLANRTPKLAESDGSARGECKVEVGDGVRNYVCRNTTMAQLADNLPSVASAYLDHPVVDLTGLKGAYDFTLSWSPAARVFGNAGRGASGDAGQPSAVPAAAAPTGGLTLFEGVAKLGLKLAAQKHPMPVLVIDHVDRTPAD